MGQQRFIGKPLVGSKNFYRGVCAERRVADYLQAQGLMLKKSRYKILNQEVDLLFQDQVGQWVIVEVKAIDDVNFLDINLRSKQVRGYLKIIEVLRGRGLSVQFWLAIVLKETEIRIIREVF